MNITKSIKTLVKRLFPSLKWLRDTNRAFQIAKNTLLSSKELSAHEKQLVQKVSIRVHQKDTMYYRFGGALHYLTVGLSAYRCIKQALNSIQKEVTINHILDFPSGHGRVLRYLKASFPNASITASEIDANALNFCRRNFSVNSFLSKDTFSEIQISKKFDLIWCGSLFTHINEQMTTSLLRFFHNHLTENGICIFSTHGTYTEELIQRKENTYRLDDNGQQEVLRQYKENSFGYTNYPNNEGYGISIINERKMAELAKKSGNWTQIMFLEKGWDKHQDVYAFQKTSK